jgi:CheY-like chemotaxis protein
MKKILLIEDEDFLIEFYQDIFKTFKLEVEIIKSGFEAIERLKEIREGKKEKPALILLDILLSDISGLDVLKEAKANPQTKDIPIFGLTAYSDPEVNKELIKEGIDKILLKTEWTPPKLISLIKETLKQKN